MSEKSPPAPSPEPGQAAPGVSNPIHALRNPPLALPGDGKTLDKKPPRWSDTAVISAIVVAVVIAVIIVAAVCAVGLKQKGSTGAASSSVTVAGVVVDANGLGVARIPVRGAGGVVSTDSTGRFTTVGSFVASSGLYVVSVNACGDAAVPCFTNYAPTTAAYPMAAAGGGPTQYFKTIGLVSLTVRMGGGRRRQGRVLWGA